MTFRPTRPAALFAATLLVACNLVFGLDETTVGEPGGSAGVGGAGGAGDNGRAGAGGESGTAGAAASSGAGGAGAAGESGEAGAAGESGAGGEAGAAGEAGAGGQGGGRDECATPPAFPRIINCTSKNECKDKDLVCGDDGRPCQINCTGETSCDSAAIQCPANGDCQLICSGDRSCRNVELQCGTGYCEVVCRDNANTCDAMQDVACGNAGTCLVTCDASMVEPPHVTLCGGSDHPSGCLCSDATCFPPPPLH